MAKQSNQNPASQVEKLEQAESKSVERTDLFSRVVASGVELSPEERNGLMDLSGRLEESRRGVINMGRRMSFGDFVTANDSPNPFSLAAAYPSKPIDVSKPLNQGA